MKHVHGIDIHSGPVGLAFSGGADSAILLYLLLSNTTETVHAYSFLTAKKRHINEPVTERVLKKCVELTGNNNVQHHKKYIDVQTPAIIHSAMMEVIHEDSLTVMYTGMTKFPPDSVTEQLEGFKNDIDQYLIDQRGPNKIRSTYFSNKFYRPFINLDRRDVKKIYEDTGVEKDIFPLTRSCETITSPLKHCGRCFWCQERQWGFGYLE
jgi:7-cyano-7-deazaguanine synthase in queuosine biosynthesis